jgi:hypothetical protein
MTVTTTCVVTVWTTWHVRWHARSSPSFVRCCNMPPVSSVKKREGRGVHAAAHLAVVGCHVTIAPASCVKKSKRGGSLCCSPGIVRRRVCQMFVARSPLATWPCFSCEKRRRGGDIHYSPCSADDMCRHCLDDLARPLTCQVVTFHHCRSSVGLVTWHCHVAVVVGMHNGGGHWSNDSCARWWSLLAGVSQRM